MPIRCGPQAFDGPGWLEADTVSYGGGGGSGGEVGFGLERIEKRMPFPMLGFDCDNGSEFLNEIVEAYLLRHNRNIEWTRSRAYKKNDQNHVEQKKPHPRPAAVGIRALR